MDRSDDIEATTREASARGYTPLALHPGEKRPVMSDWPDLRYLNPDAAVAGLQTARDRLTAAGKTDGGINLGLALGEASGGLVDVDLDHPKAVAAARRLLPHTAMRSGRMTAPLSHYWYRITDDVPERTDRRTLPKYTLPGGEKAGGEVIIELRSTGGQTVIPPSLHPNGEEYEWGGEPFGGDEGPAVVAAVDLRARVLIIALIVTLADAWPTRGGRHDAYLALAGMMLRERGPEGTSAVNPVWERNAEAVVSVLADLTNDDDGAAARVAECIPTTLRHIESDEPVQGFPTLASLLTLEKHAQQARSLLFEIEQVLGHTREHAGRDEYLSAARLPEPPDPDARDDGDGDVEDVPVLLDLTNSVYYGQVVQRARDLQIRDEAKRLYDDARAAANEVSLELEPLDLVVNAEPEPAPRVESFVPHEGATLLVAQAKTGKTTMCLNMARSLLTGEPFLGRFEVRPITAHRNVAMLNFEMTPAHIADWCMRLDMPRDRFLLLNQKGKGNPFRREKDRERLRTLLMEWDVEVLFVDTFAAAYVGESQNDANEVRPWLEDLLTLSRSAGIDDLILTTHAGVEGNRPRGSTALADWPDQMIFLTCDEPTDKSAPRYVHTAGRIDGIGKSQYTHDSETLRQVIPDGTDLGSVTSLDFDASPLVKAREAVVEILLEADGTPLTASDLDKRVQLKSGVGREFAASARREAENGGWVVITAGARNSKPHRLADDWEDRYRDAFPD